MAYIFGSAAIIFTFSPPAAGMDSGDSARGNDTRFDNFTISFSRTEPLRGSGSILAVNMESQCALAIPPAKGWAPPPAGRYWFGMFASDANLSAINDYHNYCPPGGCAPTTPPWVATAPIKFWHLPRYCPGFSRSYEVFVVNYRKPIIFAVFAHFTTPKLVYKSAPITFARLACEPTAVHLSRTAVPGQYRVTWQSGEPAATLRWRRRDDATWGSQVAITTTYTPDTVCGVPANMSIGWFDPGYIHTGVFNLTDLSHRPQYEYSVGTPNCSTDALGAFWSRWFEVRPPPPRGAPTTKVLFYGDMGVSSHDTPPSEHHWQQTMSVTVFDVMAVDASSGDYDAVWHIGDMSYATGYMSAWEGFMAQIEPLAAVVPYYTSPGNHERCSPDSGSIRQGDDSGGECGVPFNYRFIQPAGDVLSKPVAPGSSDPRQPFYSDDIGPVHVVFASTEHDLHPGSEQYAFLVRDLAAVNRTVTPHVVFTGHRPMYASTTVGEIPYGGRYVASNASFNWAMAEALEPLFEKHAVSLALWGHVHNYERTCPILNQTCRSDAKGTTHITAGTAGAGASLFPTFNASSGMWTVRTCASNGSDSFVGIRGVSTTCQKCPDVTSCTAGYMPCKYARCAPPPSWSISRIEHHGYVRIAATRSEMHVEYVAVNLSQPLGTEGLVMDRVVISARR